jgi:hypothetical protein
MSENAALCLVAGVSLMAVCFIALGLQSGCKWLLARLRAIL